MDSRTGYVIEFRCFRSREQASLGTVGHLRTEMTAGVLCGLALMPSGHLFIHANEPLHQ